MTWIDAYDRLHKPTLRNYLSPPAMALLETLNNELFQRYRIKAAPPRYTQKNGWVFPYRLQGLTLFPLVIRDETGFAAGDLIVEEEAHLKQALAEIDLRCQSGFLQKAEDAVASRKEKARNKRLLEPDTRAEEPEALLPGSDPEKLNQFSWIPALSPAELRRLYRSSANGMLDHGLLDQVGILFYLRCKQGIEGFKLIRSGKLKCHHCGSLLLKEEGLMVCRCGYQYAYKGYIDSFNAHRMPGGNALHIFSEFAEKWPGAQTDSQKMNLIDWMIHQCHINMSSGLRMRSILKNLIDAPQRTAEKLILELAYGDPAPQR